MISILSKALTPNSYIYEVFILPTRKEGEKTILHQMDHKLVSRYFHKLLNLDGPCGIGLDPKGYLMAHHLEAMHVMLVEVGL